ncbi:MAG: M56 family metallopeptidase, partial [Micromonosporaceae bacterium]|nr:M56 family metallopeptidase [Micromonosporaceae bacterium]
MRLAVFLPFLASAWFALVGPVLLRRARPSIGVWAGTIGAGVAAAGSTWSLGLLVASLIDTATGVVEEVAQRRSARALLSAEPRLTQALAVLAVPLLAAACWRLWRVVTSRRRLYRTLRAACPGDGDSDLVVLDDPVPEAFALPGRPPYVVVSSGMLGALAVPERRVLLAHERAHLADRHSRHIAVADVAAALNPMLFGVRRACLYLCERWADERAAAAVDD